jgi:hypothetical protein
MKPIVQTIAAVVIATFISCRRSPTPFDFTFVGEASGSGFVTVDQLSTDRLAGVVVNIGLTSVKGSRFESKHLVRLRDTGYLDLALQTGSSDPDVCVGVYEFTNAVSGFNWYHGNFATQASRHWTAESGDIFVHLQRTGSTNRICTAWVTLSNVVFTNESVGRKKLISELTIPEVSVGGMRY